MPKHRIRHKINCRFSRTAAAHIKRGDLTDYTTDDEYIYKTISNEAYVKAITEGDNEPFQMKELGLIAEYDKQI